MTVASSPLETITFHVGGVSSTQQLFSKRPTRCIGFIRFIRSIRFTDESTPRRSSKANKSRKLDRSSKSNSLNKLGKPFENAVLVFMVCPPVPPCLEAAP